MVLQTEIIGSIPMGSTFIYLNMIFLYFNPIYFFYFFLLTFFNSWIILFYFYYGFSIYKQLKNFLIFFNFFPKWKITILTHIFFPLFFNFFNITLWLLFTITLYFFWFLDYEEIFYIYHFFTFFNFIYEFFLIKFLDLIFFSEFFIFFEKYYLFGVIPIYLLFSLYL